MSKAASVSDYRALARARLPHFLFEYLDGGSYDEVTLARNVADLRAVALRQRVLRDVSDDRSFDGAVRESLGDAGRPRPGRPVRAVCPARRSAGRARGRRGACAVHLVDCSSACPIGEVARSGAPFWFQLYIVKDRGFVARHDRAGARGRLRRLAADRRSCRARLALSRLSFRPVRRVGGNAPRCAGAAAAGLGVGRRRPRPAAQPRQSRAAARRGRGARAT